jgi:hypothetical protein
VAEAAGQDIRGTVGYTGSRRGAVRFEPGGGGAGSWQPQADPEGNRLRVTVKLLDPVSVTLLKDAGIGTLGGLPGTGGGLDVLPVLRGGSYRCDDATLQVRTEQDGPTLTWVFRRIA